MSLKRSFFAKVIAALRKILLVVVIILFIPLKLNALTLQCVIAHTLDTNPDVLETIHTLEATHEQVKQAQADFYPVIDVTTAFGREASRNINTGGEWVNLWRKEVGISLRQMLFDGFATRNEELRTMSLTDAQAYRVYSESEDIALAAAETYISVMRDQELVQVAERNVATHKRLYSMIKRRADQGVGRVSDTYQASSRLAAAQTALFDILRQFNEDKIVFQRVTGLCPDCLVMPPNPNDLPCDQADIVKVAVCYHPTLKTSTAEVEAARALHRAAFAPNFPRVDLLINANSNQDLGGVPGPNDSRSAIVRLQWNIFRGGKDFARQRETAFNVKKAVDIRDQVYRKVVEQVSLSWNALMISRERAPAQVRYKEDSAKTAEAFYKLFMVGRSSLFDLLGVERERFIAAQEYIDNKYVNLIAKYRILNAMGQLNNYLHIAISDHARPCFRTLERAGSYYGPLEMDYDALRGGCCRKPCGKAN